MFAALAAVALFAPLDPPEVKAWSEDLDYLRREMPVRHVNLYHTLTQDRLDREFSSLKNRLPSLTRNEVIVEIKRIVALVGDRDGHTGLNFLSPAVGFHIVPLLAHAYADGIFVRAADNDHADVGGGSLVSIGDTPVKEAVQKLLAIANGDNDLNRLSQVVRLMAIPEVLRALKIVSGNPTAPVPYVIEKDGKRTTVSLEPRTNLEGIQWVDVRDASPTKQLARKHAGPNPFMFFIQPKANWFEHLPDRNAVYAHYGAVGDSAGESVQTFFQKVFQTVDEKAADKLIIDVRANGGGNNFLNRPVLYEILKRDQTVNRRGHLFVLMGRDTFSAAQNFVTSLEQHTQAMFVGEPSGGSPNHYGDASPITLPNSKVQVRVATVWWQDGHSNDTRAWLEPHLAAEQTIAADRAGRDLALEAALDYKQEPSLTETLRGELPKGIGAIEGALKTWLARPEHKYRNAEHDLYALGSSQFGANLELAVAIFELAAKTYPRSWRAQENLGRAYQGAQKKDQAIVAYRAAIALNPKASRSRQNLEALGERP